MYHQNDESSGGFTLVELVIGITVLSIVAISFFGLFTALVRSSLVAKRKAVASSLATNQIEYLKSLPYDSLAIAGGSFYSPSPLPATSTQKVDGFTYTIATSINYVDDAFDGCGSYPNQTIKEELCRNYPPPASAGATDTNAADYKIINVAVKNSTGSTLASVDTQVSARVAETSSTTGALLVNVIDSNGNPIQGAAVNVTDTTITPNIIVNDTSDSNGIAIFYNLPPDSNAFDYSITASLAGYSTLNTIVPSGSLVPTYPNQKIFTQLSSYVTVTLKPQGPDSIVLEAVNTTNTPINNMRIYAKGGYKRYTDPLNTAYYFDNVSPSDTRPTTDSSGLTSLRNLIPGSYYFCGDLGATSCVVGGTTYYLVAAVPYTGNSSYFPINVPTYLTSAPPTTTFAYSGNNYYQKARLIFSTNSSFPRISSLSVNEIALSTSNLSNFSFVLKGFNLPCNASAASCTTAVKVLQGANTYTASCTGPNFGALGYATILNCTVNLTSISAGITQLSITSSGNTYTSPIDLVLGSFNVIP